MSGTSPTSTRFAVGDRVRVQSRHKAGHIRTPTYLKGKRGRIERIMGAFPSPEELAYGRPGLPPVPLYWVRFSMDEVWAGKGSYAPADTLAVEVYEHWLDPEA